MEEIINLFLDKQYRLRMGKGSLANDFSRILQREVTEQEIYNGKKLARLRLAELSNNEIPKLHKSLIKVRDTNRVINKENREFYRVLNTLEELNEAVLEKFNEVDFKYSSPKNTFTVGDVLLVQLSDTHFNELVDLPNNTYDFNVASKRMAKYFMKIENVTKNRKISKVVLAITGDLINSDRRLDEITSAATNRTKASLIAVSLIQHFINDLLTIAPVDVAYVTGNESRVKEEWGLSDFAMTDNYDTAIFNMLKLVFKKTQLVNFISSNPVEAVLNINGKNILMLHGTTIKRDTQASIQQIMGKYSAKGIVIDYVIFGHVHFANITDLYGRSGSLVGNNVYSDYGINLVTRASQNTYIISQDGDIDSFRFELDKVTNIKGYNITDDIEVYNAKSTSKLYQGLEIVKIVI